MNKRCTKCGITKPLIKFKKQQENKNRYSSWCKQCHCKDQCLRQLKDRSKPNENNRKYKQTVKGQVTARKYKHGDMCREARKRYNNSPLGKSSSARCRYNRATRNKGVINDLTMMEWEKILKLQGNKCVNCQKVFDGSSIFTRAERDHIIPLVMGGALTENNVQALCRSCNAIKFTSVTELI